MLLEILGSLLGAGISLSKLKYYKDHIQQISEEFEDQNLLSISELNKLSFSLLALGLTLKTYRKKNKAFFLQSITLSFGITTSTVLNTLKNLTLDEVADH